MAFQLFMMAAGAGLQSYSALRSGRQQSENLIKQAGYYDRQAMLETVKGEYDVARHREATDRVLSKQRNAYLGMGFSLNGTPSDVAFDSITESEKDVYAIRWSAQIKADNYRAEAENTRAKAKGVRDASLVNAITPWLGVAGSSQGSAAISSFGKSIFSASAGGGIPYAPDDL